MLHVSIKKKKKNHCETGESSFLKSAICCGRKARAVQNDVFQDVLAQLWNTAVKEGSIGMDLKMKVFINLVDVKKLSPLENCSVR